MIAKTISLYPFEDAKLHIMCHENTPELKLSLRRAVIVCPGGGYHFVSDREAEPIAVQFLAAGFQTFVLRYTVGEGAKDFAPLKQVALAIKYVREHAEEYHIDPAFVYTCGFSAGGHLAASAGVLWHSPVLREVLGDAPKGINRPTGMILSYPVISAGEYAHRGSFTYLCGKKEPTEEELNAFSLEKQVDETCPPAFIWHTAADTCVPVQNSLLFAGELARLKVPFELHIFPTGHHGLSLCNEFTSSEKESNICPHNEVWMPLAIAWARMN